MNETVRELSFWHPAKLLGTWFGAGLSPWISGTVGSAAAVPFAWVILYFGGSLGLLIASVLCFLVGWWACEVYCRETGKKDASELVIDEVAGMWLVLCFVWFVVEQLQKYGSVSYAEFVGWFFFLHLLGFLLFRLFDIWKPWPVRWADRKVKGGLGVMLDDIFAALYVPLTVILLIYILMALFHPGFAKETFL